MGKIGNAVGLAVFVTLFVGAFYMGISTDLERMELPKQCSAACSSAGLAYASSEAHFFVPDKCWCADGADGL